jgi:hypothetical protein
VLVSAGAPVVPAAPFVAAGSVAPAFAQGAVAGRLALLGLDGATGARPPVPTPLGSAGGPESGGGDEDPVVEQPPGEVPGADAVPTGVLDAIFIDLAAQGPGTLSDDTGWDDSLDD